MRKSLKSQLLPLHAEHQTGERLPLLQSQAFVQWERLVRLSRQQQDGYGHVVIFQCREMLQQLNVPQRKERRRLQYIIVQTQLARLSRIQIRLRCQCTPVTTGGGDPQSACTTPFNKNKIWYGPAGGSAPSSGNGVCVESACPLNFELGFITQIPDGYEMNSAGVCVPITVQSGSGGSPGPIKPIYKEN